MIKLFKRLIHEIYIPSRQVSKYTIQMYVQIKNSFKFNNKDVFVACWDMAVAGPSFDFGFFLAAADYVSQKKGFSKFYILIIESKGEFYGINSENDNNSWRLTNIIYPLCKMYERCGGFEYIKDKKTLEFKLKKNSITFYPTNYDLNHVKAFQYSDFIYETNLFSIISGFSANNIALEYCKSYFEKNKKLVTITLRSKTINSPNNKKNFNSNIKEWLKASEYFIKKNYNVIIIPDTFSHVPKDFIKIGCIPFVEASQNLMIRMAIYELSFVNLFVPMGPATLGYLNKKVNYIIFKFFTEGVMYAPGVEEATEEARWRQFRIKPGEGWKFSKSTQIISKYEDKADYIIKEFNRFLSLK